jgi:hypothetical protein
MFLVSSIKRAYLPPQPNVLLPPLRTGLGYRLHVTNRNRNRVAVNRGTEAQCVAMQPRPHTDNPIGFGTGGLVLKFQNRGVLGYRL